VQTHLENWSGGAGTDKTSWKPPERLHAELEVFESYNLTDRAIHSCPKLYRSTKYDPALGRLSMEELILNISRLPDDDDEILGQLTHRLRRELIELDVQNVDVVRSGEAPEGTRAGEMIPVWGQLAVSVAGAVAGAVVPALVSTVQSWLKRNEGRSVTLKICGDKASKQVTGVSSKQQHERLF